MVPMRVQSQQHGCTFLDNPDSRVTTSVNATFVSFGQTKPTFQIQVVARQISPATAREQSLLETHHHAPHLLADRIFVFQQSAPNGVIEPLSLCPASGSGVQGCVYLANG